MHMSTRPYAHTRTNMHTDELLRCMVNGLADELRGASVNWVRDTLGGEMSQQIVLSSGATASETKIPTLGAVTLEIPVRYRQSATARARGLAQKLPPCTLEECLAEATAADVLDGENKYQCQNGDMAIAFKSTVRETRTRTHSDHPPIRAHTHARTQPLHPNTPAHTCSPAHPLTHSHTRSQIQKWARAPRILILHLNR